MAKVEQKNLNDVAAGFSKLDRFERWDRLVHLGVLSSEDVEYLKKGGIKDLSLGDKFIENVIGYFQLPLGVATNFVIDGVLRWVPMAVEETSIVAAASKTAKWVKEVGRIETRTIGQEAIGQIQIAKVKSLDRLLSAVETNKVFLIDQANLQVADGLVRRGGGVKDIQVRFIERPDGFGQMAVIHVLVDTCDAMGANIVNQVCEFLKRPIEELSGESVSMCILSNLVDTRLTEAVVSIDKIEPELAEKIEEASIFAECDPYRAATNNKGVLNGIDPILIATGNDWRAVEAGVHAFAARSGQYRSITNWRRKAGGGLEGIFRAPVVVGIVGGVTKLHPTAQIALRMMEIETADHLSRICAAVGLVQNLGALKALTTVGIIEGHMKLHIQNLALGAGAEEREIPLVQKKLEEFLKLHRRISLSQAVEILKEMRTGQSLTSRENHS